MPDVLIAPDKLRGTYTAVEAAEALARGWREVRDDSLRLLPLADGGEGTAAALLAARGGRWETADVHDALGRPCRARFAVLDGGDAALDVAEACGLWRVADVPPRPDGRLVVRRRRADPGGVRGRGRTRRGRRRRYR